MPRRTPMRIGFGLSAPAARLLADGLRGSGGPLRRIAGWSVLEAAPALASGWVTAAALDHGFLAGRPGVGLAWIALLAGLFFARAAAERALFTPLAEVVEDLRDTLVRRVVGGVLERATADGRGGGSAAVAQLNGQVDTVRNLTGTLLRTARPLSMSLLAAVIGLAALDPVLAGLVLAPLVPALAVFFWSMRRLTARRRLLVLAEEEVAGRAGAALGASRDITALAAEPHAASIVEQEVAGAAKAQVAVGLAAAMRVPVVLLGGQLPLILLLLAGPGLVAHGSVSAGAVVGAATYVAAHLLPALQMLAGAVSGYWSQLGVVLHRLAEAATMPEPPSRHPRSDPSPEPPRPSEPTRVPGPSAPAPAPRGPGEAPDISVRDLDFAYGPHAEPVLRRLSLDVPFGDRLAVVGPSGIGKSTLAALLAGIIPPTAGTVSLDGRPVTDLDEALRCRLFALVPQEAYVFPGTVAANLAYLAPDAEPARLERSAAAVGLTEVIDRLGGLDARLRSPSTELSSGERQLFALARVHASTAPVVLLDEATCHLDPVAEQRAEAALAERPGTLIVIAHRLVSATRARRVLLLDGDRTALGTHAELLVRSPHYAELVGHWTGTTQAGLNTREQEVAGHG
ncbi:ATP-binding cassette domain-containing protein [Streptomyces sp. NPDC004284]|uniref:ATP-binding cassette domain-containing protein n=1 Tax=Streptomyces sp. NPDC004284 TaxID=3364695 RepID=UPI0036B2D2BD